MTTEARPDSPETAIASAPDTLEPGYDANDIHTMLVAMNDIFMTMAEEELGAGAPRELLEASAASHAEIFHGDMPDGDPVWRNFISVAVGQLRERARKSWAALSRKVGRRYGQHRLTARRLRGRVRSHRRTRRVHRHTRRVAASSGSDGAGSSADPPGATGAFHQLVSHSPRLVFSRCEVRQ